MIVVVGSGICGAACALFAQDRGAEVLLLDRGTLSSQTTGRGEGNVLEADAPGGHTVWHALADRFGDVVRLRAKGSLTLLEDDGADALAATVPGAEVVPDPRALEPALAPGLPPAVLVAHDLQVDPRATARAMAAEVPHREHAEVVRAEAGGVTLAGGERIVADAVVLACGPWAGELAPELEIRPRRGQLIALGPAPGLVTRKLIDARYPAAVAAVIEEAIGGEVYVGSSRHDVGFDDTVDDAVTVALLERATRFVPALAGLPVRRVWTGLRPARDGGPFVGQLESGVWACAGHEGAGVGCGPRDALRLAAHLAS